MRRKRTVVGHVYSTVLECTAQMHVTPAFLLSGISLDFHTILSCSDGGLPLDSDPDAVHIHRVLSIICSTTATPDADELLPMLVTELLLIAKSNSHSCNGRLQ